MPSETFLKLGIYPLPLSGVAALLLYIGFLLLGLINPLSMLFIGIGISVALLLMCFRLRLSWFALVTVGLVMYKITYYFLLNWPVPLDTTWLNQEGRFLVSLAILLAFAGLRTSIQDLNFFIKWASWAYLVWLPLLLAHVVTGRTLISGSHHQLGLTAISGLFMFLVRNKYHSSTRYWLVLSIGLFAILITNSRTSLLMSLLMVLGPVWIKMKFRVKAVTLCFMGAMIFLFAGEQIKLGERIYDLGAYSYLVKAINYGYANCNRLSEAYQAKEANIKGADFNVIGRGAMYGKALGLFVSSPVFGVGEGRFDDVSASCENINELGCIHFFGSSNFDGTTAHNTFLHLLAEEGIFGLAITLIVVVLLYRRVKARSYWLEQYGFNYSIIKMLFWMLLFSAMFNHVLASPLYVLALILPLLMFSSLIIPTHSSRRAVL